jgi:hypothetical protein
MMESSMTQSQYKKHFIKFPKIELTVSNSNFCSTFLKEKKKKKGLTLHNKECGYQYSMVNFLKVVPLKKRRRYFCPCT